MPPLRILDEGWERLPRIAVARAGRMIWRGLPLFGAAEWRDQAIRVLEEGRDFSLGVQTNPFAMRQKRACCAERDNSPSQRGLRSSQPGLRGYSSIHRQSCSCRGSSSESRGPSCHLRAVGRYSQGRTNGRRERSDSIAQGRSSGWEIPKRMTVRG